MNKIYLKTAGPIFKKIKDFLLQDSEERVIFLLTNKTSEITKIIFEIKDIYLVPQNEIDQSSYSVRLKQISQAKIIKWAWDSGFSLAEIHSHPFSNKNTTFSYSDVVGLKEFVPHVWWRLKNKPYIAMVFGKRDYDALVWIDSPHSPKKLEGVLVENKLFRPTNSTLFNQNYDRRSKI